VGHATKLQQHLELAYGKCNRLVKETRGWIISPCRDRSRSREMQIETGIRHTCTGPLGIPMGISKISEWIWVNPGFGYSYPRFWPMALLDLPLILHLCEQTV